MRYAASEAEQDEVEERRYRDAGAGGVEVEFCRDGTVDPWVGAAIEDGVDEDADGEWELKKAEIEGPALERGERQDHVSERERER